MSLRSKNLETNSLTTIKLKSGLVSCDAIDFNNSIKIGADSASTGSNNVVIGDNASTTQDHSILIGSGPTETQASKVRESLYVGIQGRSSPCCIAIGSSGSDGYNGAISGANGAVAIGSSSNGNAAISTSTGGVAIGGGKNGGAMDRALFAGIAIGGTAPLASGSANHTGALTLGMSTIAIGGAGGAFDSKGAIAKGICNVVIGGSYNGFGAYASNASTSSVAIGGAVSNNEYQGVGAYASSKGGIAIGGGTTSNPGAQTTQSYAIAIGSETVASHEYSVCIGKAAASSANNQLTINVTGGITPSLQTAFTIQDTAPGVSGSLVVPANAEKFLSITVNGVDYELPLYRARA